MKLLEDRIKKDGIVKSNEIIMVDSFLNHQMDPELFSEMAKEWRHLYEGEKIDKILTIEASGIGLAVMAGHEFGCPVIFAKRSRGEGLQKNVYAAKVMSYTYSKESDIVVSKKFLGKGDRVLILDDFLSNGAALCGLIGVCRQAGAEIVGAAIAIEKQFQSGGDMIRNDMGVRVESLAKIISMDPETGIVFG